MLGLDAAGKTSESWTSAYCNGEGDGDINSLCAMKARPRRHPTHHVE